MPRKQITNRATDDIQEADDQEYTDYEEIE